MTTPWNMARAASRRPLPKPRVEHGPVGMKAGLDDTVKLNERGCYARAHDFDVVLESRHCRECGYHVCSCPPKAVAPEPKPAPCSCAHTPVEANQCPVTFAQVAQGIAQVVKANPEYVPVTMYVCPDAYNQLRVSSDLRSAFGRFTETPAFQVHTPYGSVKIEPQRLGPEQPANVDMKPLSMVAKETIAAFSQFMQGGGP